MSRFTDILNEENDDELEDSHVYQVEATCKFCGLYRTCKSIPSLIGERPFYAWREKWITVCKNCDDHKVLYLTPDGTLKWITVAEIK